MLIIRWVSKAAFNSSMLQHCLKYYGLWKKLLRRECICSTAPPFAFPLHLHHSDDSTVENIGYSYELAAVLKGNGKPYEFYTYEGGGHNIISPYFDQAIFRTVEFFRQNL